MFEAASIHSICPLTGRSDEQFDSVQIEENIKFISPTEAKEEEFNDIPNRKSRFLLLHNDRAIIKFRLHLLTANDCRTTVGSFSVT